MSDDFETTVKLTRGTGAQDRETFKTKVTAPDLETLNERVNRLREHVEEWADGFRTIQPDDRGRSFAEDQSTLGEAES